LHQSVTNGFTFVFLAPRPGCVPQVLPYTLLEAREYLAAYRQQQEDVAVARAMAAAELGGAVAAAAGGRPVGSAAGGHSSGETSVGLTRSRL
jgi:hypothetical protein